MLSGLIESVRLEGLNSKSIDSHGVVSLSVTSLSLKKSHTGFLFAGILLEFNQALRKQKTIYLPCSISPTMKPWGMLWDASPDVFRVLRNAYSALPCLGVVKNLSMTLSFYFLNLPMT